MDTKESEHSKYDLEPPYWECRCGVRAMPLTDLTTCDCNDIYEQDWRRIEADANDLWGRH